MKIPRGVIKSHKSKKYRQYNGQHKWDRKTNNDLQNTITDDLKYEQYEAQ